MTLAGRRLVVKMDVTKISCTVATSTWKVIVPGRIEAEIFLIHSALWILIHLLIMEFLPKHFHLGLFHLKLSSLNTAIVYGGGSRI